MKQYHIAVFVGSLRKGSFARKLALNLSTYAPENLTFQLIEIGDLPLYNQEYDDDNQVPSSYTRFRDEVAKADGFLFVTPEYNRSTTPAMKNALDVGSRPYGESVWDGKPGAVISISPGAMGGFGANHHLRQSLVFLNVLTLQQPEAYLGTIHKWFDDQGKIVDEKNKKYVQSILAAFGKWVEQVHK